MKLIVAIVNGADAEAVSESVTRAGFSVTRLSTTGGFLQTDNATFLVGADEQHVDEVIALIERHSNRRSGAVSGATYGATAAADMPVEVTVSGATVFVLDVERFEKL